MNRCSLLGNLLLWVIAFGCSEETQQTNGETESSPGGNGGPTSAEPTDAVDDGAGGGAGAAPLASGGAGQQNAPELQEPLPPFVIESGLCQPNAIEAPEPIYESGHFNASINSVTGTRDEVFFAESSSFNEIPPRIARVGPGGEVETLLDGEFSNLKVLGDTLYFVGASELLSLDLATLGAEPQVLMTVSNVLEYDEQRVLYYDADNAVWIAPLGAGSTDAGVAGTLLLPEWPTDVALLGDTVYYSDGDSVLKLGVDGGEPTPLFPPDSFNFVTSVGTDGTLVFFDNSDVLTTVPIGGGQTLELGLAGKDGLFDDTAAFSGFLAGRGIVYWIDDGSTFGWTALDGQSCGVLGSYSSFFEAQGHLTDGDLFVGGDSGLYRVARVD